MEHITNTFAALKKQGRAALMPYFTLGFPTLEGSLAVIETLAGSGADLIELGVPFSDPLADGPTIQHSTQVALEQGMNVARCLEAVAVLRARGVEQPLLLMGYINPILAYGIERYAAGAAAVGANGLIVPDLPLEESQALDAACRANGLALIYLVSPASTPERIAMLAERTTGFLYLVSLTGVTGARSQLNSGLVEFVERVRGVARTPLAVGFGISTPEQAQAVARTADGVIIGSALISAVAKSAEPVRAAADFLSGIHAVLGSGAEDKRLE
ncbi:MAG: tryptophan synthase subunit alpha [Anaerolineaceae bacterium]|nr:tryptophan synthase subunit alpha [Anaerolineaceae bacterium]